MSSIACISLVIAGGSVGPVYQTSALVSTGGYGAGGCVGAGCGLDFNPYLLNGMRGYPGIRVRVNQPLFQYASGLVGELLNNEIKKARIPDIVRSTKPQIDGCAIVYNLYVSRYRCPQRIVVYPHAPNRIVLQVQNVDIGVTGNLGGQVNVLIPLALTGIVQANVHGVTITVEASIERGPNGPIINICSCNIDVGYVDICIENGGLVGQVVNTFFRKQLSDQVRSLLPSEICKQLPSIVNEKINGRLSSFPQAIALTQLASLLGGALSGGSGPNPQFAGPTLVQPQTGLSVASPDLCSQCTSADDPTGFLKELAAGLDLRRLSDLFLSIQVMNTYATENDFTVDLTGEFSPGGQGGTPFGPFPVQFPTPYDSHMVEAIISDYTVNTLFYHMHKKGFLSFRIGPDTPKIGDLLKTTCGDDEDDELEDRGVEIDEEEARKKRLQRRHLQQLLLHHRQKRETDVIALQSLAFLRHKRQDLGGAGGFDAGSLTDLGICFGDILPAVREKYPNQLIAVVISTVRAPSILLSRSRGGSAQLDLLADADIFIDGSNIKVGTITIAATVNIAIQVKGSKLYGNGDISALKLTDRTGSLGLPQDALDNLGTLGKELLIKLANDALGKGIPINIQQSSAIPVTIYNPSISIIEHGLYVAADITISPALLGILGSCYA